MPDFQRRASGTSLIEYIASQLDVNNIFTLSRQDDVAAAPCTAGEGRSGESLESSDSKINDGGAQLICSITRSHRESNHQVASVQKHPMPKSWLRRTSGEVKALRTQSLMYPIHSLKKEHFDASKASLAWASVVLHSSACALNPEAWRRESENDASCAVEAQETNPTSDSGEEQVVSVDFALSEALWTIEDSLNISSDSVLKSFHSVLLWLSSALEREGGLSVGHYGHCKDNTVPVRSSVSSVEWGSLIARDDSCLTVEGFQELMSPVVSLRNFSYLNGPVKYRDRHLKRVRLLLLLIRAPLVLRASARLLASCEGPAYTSEGCLFGERSSHGFATAPACQDSSPSMERQQSLLRETALVFHAQMEELKAAMLPFSKPLAVEQPAEEFQSASMIDNVKSSMYNFDDGVVAAFAEAITPANLHWRVNPCLKPLDETFAKAGAWPFWLSEETNADEDMCVVARKVALELLTSVKALLLSFSLKIEASPKCRDRYGVMAAAAEESVSFVAQGVLNDIDTAFLMTLPKTQNPDSFTELPVVTWSRCVTRMCSRILTAKDMPKAFQDNPHVETSRMLLDYKSAAAAEKLQLGEQCQEGQSRCPLTGRLHLPHGLPDEQLAWQTNNHATPASGHLMYITDEGCFRMAAQVARILIGLLKCVPIANDERSSAFVIPPLLRLFDVPQPEVRFLSCHCLEIFVSNSSKDALQVYSIPILQALEQAFPVNDEVDTCYSKYLHAFSRALLTLYSDGSCHKFLSSLEFLYDMSYCGLIDKNEYRLIFLKEVTPLLEHAGTAVNLTLYNWLELALHALQGQTTESITQGLQSLSVVLDLATDVEDYLPEIVSRLAVVEAGLYGISRASPDIKNSTTSKSVRDALDNAVAKLSTSVGQRMLSAVISNIEESLNSFCDSEQAVPVSDMLYGLHYIRTHTQQNHIHDPERGPNMKTERQALTTVPSSGQV